MVHSLRSHGSKRCGLQSGGNVRLDPNDNVFATFYGGSNSFPLKNAFSSNAGNDAHIIELNSTASTLLMSTALGTGGGIALNNSLSLDSNLNAYFSGSQAPNTYGGTYFPVTPNAFSKTLQGNADGFVVKIITQQQPTATTLNVSPSGNITPTQSVTLTAAVASTSTLTGIPTTPTGTVYFLNGATVLGTGTITAGKASYTGMLPAGSDSITAVFAGDSGFNGSTSAATVVTVSSAVATTTSLVVSPATATSGQAVTLTSTPSPAPLRPLAAQSPSPPAT